jgi:hypothetical protein
VQEKRNGRQISRYVEEVFFQTFWALLGPYFRITITFTFGSIGDISNSLRILELRNNSIDKRIVKFLGSRVLFMRLCTYKMLPRNSILFTGYTSSLCQFCTFLSFICSFVPHSCSPNDALFRFLVSPSLPFSKTQNYLLAGSRGGNALDSYSGGARFEPRPGLRFFLIVFSLLWKVAEYYLDQTTAYF